MTIEEARQNIGQLVRLKPQRRGYGQVQPKARIEAVDDRRIYVKPAGHKSCIAVRPEDATLWLSRFRPVGV